MVRIDQSCNGIDDRCLAGTRPSQQRNQPIHRLEPGVEGKISQPMADVDGDSHSISSRRLAWRAISSEASSASMAMATETMVNLSAPASPPGTWVKVYIKDGRVCVSPGILETKVMVAPNSPMALAKHRI